jgi:hypothetical protein
VAVSDPDGEQMPLFEEGAAPPGDSAEASAGETEPPADEASGIDTGREPARDGPGETLGDPEGGDDPKGGDADDGGANTAAGRPPEQKG